MEGLQPKQHTSTSTTPPVPAAITFTIHIHKNGVKYSTALSKKVTRIKYSTDFYENVGFDALNRELQIKAILL